MMKLSIHYTFWLLVFVFLFSGLYVEIMIFFGIIFLHESGHLLACLAFHQKIKRINITALGGLIDIEVKEINSFKQLIINISGVLVNLGLLSLAHLIVNPYYHNLFINYNKLLIIFNLLPIYPLDGYRIIETILALVINRPFREQKILYSLSIIGIFLLSYYMILNKSFAFLLVVCYLLFSNIIYHRRRQDHAIRKYISRYNGTLIQKDNKLNSCCDV